jgi:type I restriction enzyme, S subunit
MATKNQNNQALVPELRFPEFCGQTEWKAHFLGDLCEIKTGKKDANQGNQNGRYPFFTCAERHIYSDSYSFDCEAILIAGNANVGQTKYYKGRFDAYQRTYVLSDFLDVRVDYLFKVLDSALRPALQSKMQSSAMTYIKLPMLKEFRVFSPPTPAEQQKIADCLGSLDDLIAAHSRKLAALQDHKKGLLQQLFPAEGETTPKLRFPEFEGAGKWLEISIQDLIDKKHITGHLDGNHGALYPRSEEFSEEGVPYITANDFKEGRVSFERCKFLPEQRALQSGRAWRKMAIVFLLRTPRSVR